VWVCLVAGWLFRWVHLQLGPPRRPRLLEPQNTAASHKQPQRLSNQHRNGSDVQQATNNRPATSHQSTNKPKRPPHTHTTTHNNNNNNNNNNKQAQRNRNNKSNDNANKLAAPSFASLRSRPTLCHNNR